MGRFLNVYRNNAAKRLVTFLLLCCVFLYFADLFHSSADTPRKSSLRTSYDPRAYCVFETYGNDISVSGVYSGDRLRRITSPHDMIASMKFAGHEDGSFEAAFTMKAATGYSYIIFEYESGAKLYYFIKCDSSGWYFPENGLKDTNREALEHIIDLPDEGLTEYFTASGDEKRAEEVRAQVKQISDAVTEGLEDDYEKAHALNRFVAANIYYDHDAKEESVTGETVAIENVIARSRTVCIGFANYYCALMQAQGIDTVVIKCCTVTDDLKYDDFVESSVENHEFTAFWYEAQQRWVWVDPCWSGSGNYENGEYKANIPHEKYFDISDEALALEHKALYAVKRSFFPLTQDKPEAETSAPETQPPETEPEETQPAETASIPETARPQETAPAAQTTADQPPEAVYDNTSYIVLAAVLGAGVIALAVYIIRRKDQTKW